MIDKSRPYSIHDPSSGSIDNDNEREAREQRVLSNTCDLEVLASEQSSYLTAFTES